LRYLFLTLIAAGSCGTAASADSAAPAPRPFVAAYDVTYRGLGAGTIEFRLRHSGPGPRYIYESHARPSLLARLVISSKAHEWSLLRIDRSGVQPLSYQLDDGKSGETNDVALEFDWASATVRGRVEGEAVELPAEPGLQDRMSIQIAVQTSLLRRQDPGTIAMLDEDRIKRYDYRELRSERITTAAVGEVDTVVFESSRKGSSRVSRLWLAPALDFVTVRAEQIRKGKVETVMVLSAFEQTEERIMPQTPSASGS